MKKLKSLFLGTMMAATALSSTAGTFQGARDDFRDETIYFAMTTRFYDGDPKNNVLSWDKQNVQIANGDPDWRGDFAGLIDKLDYIKALGFTAIWITPITQNASGEDYHGYHSMDFSSVDLRYESRKEWGCDRDVKFQTLVDSIHAKGMKIVLDIVLNHTSNFGEARLNPLFERSQKIRNQATPAGSLIPNPDRLSNGYFDQTGQAQYDERFKFFKNPQYDTHNYYHHYGTGWNWDLPNRWWGQIAGDCVDLNTENNTVAEYLVDCYGKFIEMGVDGFRIDTTGHISRLTFNKQFIPQFMALGEKYKSKRLNGCKFYMFGECCARFGSVIYRDQHNLSSHFYTWKSPQNLLDSYDGSQEYWDTQVLNEGHDSPVGPMAVCEQEKDFNENSTNVFMENGAWHEPDYSKSSGYNVIDFPMHYNFNNAGSAVNIAKEGDKYYNDASYNVVYVDSHDYSPGPNDGTRFNGGTEQWAENLALMFTFRGIPCIYYGSEVEFKAGKPIDVGGTNNQTPRKDSGRAYFGNYLEGNVKASDFGVYTADGNVSKTLNADLAQHIIRLNKIRAAVPALRKGQYTFDGCSGNLAFKRAYKDSYALVAINGGATFTGVPAGDYVDLVTGTTYKPENGTISVSAPSNKGQLRVLVKGWTGGIVGEDGKFIYNKDAVVKGGNVEFPDVPTASYYGPDDIVLDAAVKLSPAGGNFKTETLTVTATLNEEAVSGSYTLNGATVNIAQGESKTFTIGQGMNYGETTTVTWKAKEASGKEYSGSATYKKVDPNASITIYVEAASAPNMYIWDNAKKEYAGAWPGSKPTAQKEVDGHNFWYMSADDAEVINVIFNNGSDKTNDITGITEDRYFTYDGTTGYKDITDSINKEDDNKVKVTMTPNGGTFFDTQSVTITAKNATSAWYKIGNGQEVNFTSTATFTIGEGMNVGDKVVVSWSATGPVDAKNGSATFTKADKGAGLTIPGNFNLAYSGSKTHVHYWGNNGSSWPGVQMKEVVGSDGKTYKCFKVPEGTTGIIFNAGGDQNKTGDLTYKAGFVHDDNGATSTPVTFVSTGEETVTTWKFYYQDLDNKFPNKTIYAYVWDDSNKKNYLGAWPGTAMTKQSNNVWTISFDTEDEIEKPKVVFNDNSGTQTGDLELKNGGWYSFTNVEMFADDYELAVYGRNGSMVIESSKAGWVSIMTLDGMSHQVYVEEGANLISNAGKGIYIVRAGNKVLKVVI